MKILTSPSSMGLVSPQPFDLLKQNGFEIINNPYGRKLTEDEVIELAKDCIGIVAGVEPLTSKVMDALPHLKCISRVGVGMDSVDLEYAKKKGITVVNTPDGPTLPVAELTLGMTLSLLRRIPQAHKNLSSGVWKKETGNLLHGKTVGVIGLGRIGKKVATMFKALGNQVVGTDMFLPTEWAKDNGVEFLSLTELLQSADIVTLHVPGSADKKAILGSEELRIMKSTSFLINISRGGVVDEDALLESLTNNKLAGAAIDVFDNEPYSGPLCNLDNVVLTPHLGSYAAEAKQIMEIDAVQNLLDVLKK